MKPRILIPIICCILLNSCIVKSLFPFYTKETVHFEETFLGIWADKNDKNRKWTILSLSDIDKVEKEMDSSSNKKESDKTFEKYKKGYLAIYGHENEESKTTFLVMPFKIDNQIFLDFTPFYVSTDKKLLDHHLIATHSLVKFDIEDENNVSIKWLSSDKIGELISNNRIKIKHEKIGFEEEYLLTASSEELQKFIKKFMNSNDENKWKTDVKYNLKRIDTNEDYNNILKDLVKGKMDDVFN
jgi:glucose-6-phosphate 1-dehydrogenase